MRLTRSDNIDRLKEEASHYVSIIRKEKLAKGFKYGEYHVQADTDAKTNMLGYITSIAMLTFPVAWWSYEGAKILIKDVSELQTIQGLMLQYVGQCHKEESLAIEQIKQAETIEEIEPIYNNYLGV